MSKKTPPTEEEIALFRQSMKGVTPLKGDKKARPHKTKQHKSKPKLPSTPPIKPRAVSDGIDFSISPEEVIQYFANGVPLDMRKKLIKGLIPIESKLDLHQMRREEAHIALDNFIHIQYEKGIRCCLIQHGKGQAIIKNLVARWLPQYDEVLAYHSCLAKHGGTGAVYVYIRRQR